MAGVDLLLALWYGFMDQNSGCVQISNIHRSNKIRENSVVATTHESDLAHRWWTLPRKSLLPLSNGEVYQLLSVGRPGGAMGPDVRDAMLCVAPSRHASIEELSHARCTTTCQRVGDVEFHIRSSDWRVHRHDSDPRYNNVILHVVLRCDDPQPTIRQDGKIVPICSLHDLPSTAAQPQVLWPCHQVMAGLSAEERGKLLQHAGLLRFEQKTYAFVEKLREANSQSFAESARGVLYDNYDRHLIPALVEGLGYGRDRAFFRLLGRYLIDKANGLPQLPGRSSRLSPLDTGRLQALCTLMTQWSAVGAWQTLRNLLLPRPPNPIPTLQAIRGIFGAAGLSLARTDILICNVVLPFAAAVAFLERDTVLTEQAQKLYLQHPGLPSNRVTRMMYTQLRLRAEPHQSCQQQGLQYIYQQTCQEKSCELCIAGKYDI